MSKVKHHTNLRKSTQGHFPSCSCGVSFPGTFPTAGQASIALAKHLQKVNSK